MRESILARLTDDDVQAVGNALSQELSYYVAGWDYPITAAQERAAHRKCERIAARIGAEMARRGLRTTVPTLCPIGAAA